MIEGNNGAGSAALRLPCIGELPPSYIDYVLSRDLADGVFLTGCAEDNCHHRFGIAWTKARLAGERDPHLRARVPRERLTTLWPVSHRRGELERALSEFTTRLEMLAAPRAERRAPPRRGARPSRKASHG